LFYDSSNNFPFVGLEFFGRSGRGLECVGCGDLIVVLVLDAIAAPVVTNAFFLRRPFVGGKWRVSLAWDDWGKRDPAGDIVFELLVLRVVVDFVGGPENGIGATHFG
jgi:hypothetical protein